MSLSLETSHTRLRGIRLWLARLAWSLMLVINLVTATVLLPRDPFTMFLSGTFKGSLPAVQSLVSLRNFGWYVLFLNYLVLAIFIISGMIIFLRRSDDWMVMLTSAVIISLGVEASKIDLFESRFWSLPGYDWLGTLDGINLAFSSLGLLLLLYLFPDGRFVPRRLGWWVLGILAVVYGVNLVSRFFTPLDEWWFILIIGTVLLLGGALASQVYRFRRISSPAQRLQTRWAVVGLAAYPLATLAIGPLLTIVFQGGWGYLLALHLSILVLLLIPITLGTSILRYHLWDFDLVIRRSLVYGLLSITLIVFYYLSITLLQMLFSSVSHQQSPVSIVISTLGIAALFNPLRRRIQDFIDRRFFRKKYNTERILQDFSARMRFEVDIDAMQADLLRVVDDALQPDSASLWLRPMRKGNVDEKITAE